MSGIYAQLRFFLSSNVNVRCRYTPCQICTNSNIRFPLHPHPSSSSIPSLLRRICSDRRHQVEMNNLTRKQCVPCNSKDAQPMTEEEANELLEQVKGWKLVNEDSTLKLQRSWKAKSFNKGLQFFGHVADIAEAEGHHPDLHLCSWNNVKIELWTHSVGGLDLTLNDFIIASKITALKTDCLRPNKTADT